MPTEMPAMPKRLPSSAWKTMMPRTSVITREELYERVWSAPMIKVVEKFDVSGSYLARVCTALRVPRPERGYWAKLAVGKAPKRPALPEPQPGDPIVWSRTDEFPAPSVPKPRPTPRPRVPRLTRHVTGTHGLIRGAKEHFLASRKVDEGEHLKRTRSCLSTSSPPARGSTRRWNSLTTFSMRWSLLTTAW